MLAFLAARAPGADGKPDAEKVKAFSAANPETLNQAHFVAAKPLPGSFRWRHLLKCARISGKECARPYALHQVLGHASDLQCGARGRRSQGEVCRLFGHRSAAADRGRDGEVRLLALLDRPGDPTTDVTLRWPDEDNRESVRLGTVEITSIAVNERDHLQPASAC